MRIIAMFFLFAVLGIWSFINGLQAMAENSISKLLTTGGVFLVIGLVLAALFVLPYLGGRRYSRRPAPEPPARVERQMLRDGRIHGEVLVDGKWQPY